MLKKFLVKLVNWESVRGQHKPSAEEIFKREQKTESELAKEIERQHRQNIQDDQWREVEVPKETERNPE